MVNPRHIGAAAITGLEGFLPLKFTKSRSFVNWFPLEGLFLSFFFNKEKHITDMDGLTCKIAMANFQF